MNVERINKLADIVERNEGPAGLNFSMTHITRRTTCGTVACLAGWAAVIFADECPDAAKVVLSGGWDRDESTLADTWSALVADTWQAVAPAAARALGLDMETADLLFLGSKSPCEVADVTGADAAVTLRNLAETGRVDWSHAPIDDNDEDED